MVVLLMMGVRWYDSDYLMLVGGVASWLLPDDRRSNFCWEGLPSAD
jgi:hypothetical protein